MNACAAVLAVAFLITGFLFGWVGAFLLALGGWTAIGLISLYRWRVSTRLSTKKETGNPHG